MYGESGGGNEPDEEGVGEGGNDESAVYEEKSDDVECVRECDRRDGTADPADEE